MNQGRFVGRKKELQKLQDLKRRAMAAIVVIKGRRRIGKSRLAAEFAKDKRFLSFTGLPPQGYVTHQTQREAFARQLSRQINQTIQPCADWSDTLNALSDVLYGSSHKTNSIIEPSW